MAERTVNKHWTADVQPGVRIRVRSEFFGVHFDKSDDNTVQMHAEFTFKGVPEDCEIDVPITTEWDENANEVRIDISPDWETSTNVQNISIDSHVEILVPQEVDLAAENELGGLSAKNLTGKLSLENENGKLMLVNCQGELSLENENGRTIMTGCAGNASVESENGAVEITRCHLNNADVSTENGRISFEFIDQKDGKFSFETENGKVLLVLPEAVEFTLNAQTENGGIHIGLPDEYTNDRKGLNKHIEMARGSGKVKIDIKTENGGIVLTDSPIEEDAKSQGFRFGWTHCNHTVNRGIHHKIRKRIHKMVDNGSLQEFKTQMREMGLRMKELAKDKEGNKQEMRDLGREMGRMGAEFGRQFTGVGQAIAEAVNTGIESSGLDNFFEGIFEHRGPRQPRPPRPPRPHRHHSHVHTVDPVDPVEPVEPVEPLEEENAQSKLQVLQMLRDGQITVEDAEKLLKAID